MMKKTYKIWKYTSFSLRKNKLTREEKQKITTMNNQNLFYEIKSYLFIYIFCNF